MAKRSDEEQYKAILPHEYTSDLTRSGKGWLARVKNSEGQTVASVVADEKEIARIGASAIATQLNRAGGW